MLDISPLDGIRSPFGRRRGGGPAPAFSPTSLYSSGSQGIWLDPSDLSTMFSDRAGTTPVTAPGTVVGLRLDKSKGLVLGSELVVNGTFASGTTTGWTPSSVTLSVVDGRLKVVALDNDTRFTWQSFATVVGRTYDFSFAYDSGTMSQIFYSVGTGAGGANNIAYTQKTGAATIRMFFVATATTTFINFGAWTGNSGKEAFFDNISVRELPGNHAVAPTDAARPIYGVEPKGGRRNVYTYSEDFSNAAWVKSGSPTLTNQGGGVWRVQAAAGLWSVLQSLSAAGTHTLSIDVKSNGAGLDGFQFMMGGAFVGGNRTATSEWVRYTSSATNAGSGSAGICRTTGGDAVDILIRFPQLEIAATASNYQRVTTAYDITESGVATCHYVQYDGSDDSMSTAAIDFTATDKMSVFAGVRKLSDAAFASFLELSTNASNTPGTFGLYTSVSNAANYYAESYGSIKAAVQTANTFAAPTPAVWTSTADISGDIVGVRLNGAVAGTNTANQGTGNFTNNPLFIGRRGGGSFAFNGRDYGLIVVGKAASAGEITDTETWLAARTAQVTI